MTSIGKIAQLRHLLLGMERDLGIEDLGRVQQSIVYAATLLAEQSDTLEKDEIINHELEKGVSRAPSISAIKHVVKAGS